MINVMIDYTLFSKTPYAPEQVSSLGPWDIFLSGYNLSERVRDVFDYVNAAEKHWLIFPEYRIPGDRLPTVGNLYCPETREEDVFVREFFTDIGSIHKVREKRVCIDCTGILRPHLMFLIRYLCENGFDGVDVLYSEPAYYREKEQTAFAGEVVDGCRAVRGYEGSPNPDAEEIMIIGAGYDPHLIDSVCLAKEDAEKVVLVGFPALKPEMYQENVLRIASADESLNVELKAEPGTYFVPANDPFETAAVLRQIVRRQRMRRGGEVNIYLCPLATKAQTLGFALFYHVELLNTSASVYFPFSEYYSPDTSYGLTRVWHYMIDFGLANVMRE